MRPVKIKIPLSRHEWNLTSLDSIGNWMFTLLTDCWSWDSHLIFWGMPVIYRFYFCIEYQQRPGGGRGCHCEAMKFQFHSKMHLILSDSIANLLRIVSQVSDLYLTGYNSQFISIKIDLKHRTSQLFHCPCPFHVCQRRFATGQNASAASKIDLLSVRISPKPSQRTNFHWAIKRALYLTIYQNYANIREEAFFYAKKQIG